MGRWIADYLDDAGYDNWASYPTIYKAMFVNAFPPIDPLDDKATDPDTTDIEHLATEFLKVADSHIQHNRANTALRLRPWHPRPWDQVGKVAQGFRLPS